MRSRGLEVAKDEPLAVVDVVEEGREYQRLNSHELDEDVDGGTTGVFQGVTDGVPDDCSLEVGRQCVDFVSSRHTGVFYSILMSYEKLHQLNQPIHWVVKASIALGSASEGVRQAFQCTPVFQSVAFIECLIAQQSGDSRGMSTVSKFLPSTHVHASVAALALNVTCCMDPSFF